MDWFHSALSVVKGRALCEPIPPAFSEGLSIIHLNMIEWEIRLQNWLISGLVKRNRKSHWNQSFTKAPKSPTTNALVFMSWCCFLSRWAPSFHSCRLALEVRDPLQNKYFGLSKERQKPQKFFYFGILFIHRYESFFIIIFNLRLWTWSLFVLFVFLVE